MYGPRHVVLCLLEVARRGARYGMQAALLIQVHDHSDNLSLTYVRSSSCGAVLCSYRYKYKYYGN